MIIMEDFQSTYFPEWAKGFTALCNTKPGKKYKGMQQFMKDRMYLGRGSVIRHYSLLNNNNTTLLDYLPKQAIMPNATVQH